MFGDLLVDIGTEVFYDDFDSDEEDEDNSCDRLSAYFGAFYQSSQEVEKLEKKNKLYRSLEKDLYLKKISQIKGLYHLSDQELNKYSNKQLVKFLLNRVDSNKDIVDLLNHKEIRNKLGNAYTKASIAKKRYLLKKSPK